MILIILNNVNLIPISIFFGIVFLIIFLSCFFAILNKKRNNYVKKTSNYISNIKEINDKYDFKTLTRNRDIKTFYLSSKHQFDCFNSLAKGETYIKDNLQRFQIIIEIIEYNILTDQQYLSEINSLKSTSNESIAKQGKMSLKSYLKREKKIAKTLIKHCDKDFSLEIRWEYTSPAGRNYYCDKRLFKYSKIKEIVECVENNNRTFYGYYKPKIHTKISLDDLELIE